VAHAVPVIARDPLPDAGIGARAALDRLRHRYLPWMSGSAGPRYFAFVTGGSTPAALAGDWLTAALDQNGSDAGESATRQLVLDAVAMVRELLGLPDGSTGAFVTGASTSSQVALATARQWVGAMRGHDTARDGLHALGRIRVLSGTPHSSIGKALSILGLGRAALHRVPTIAGREAVAIPALERALAEAEAAGEAPCIVVANAGTVNTCDFDDLREIAALRARHRFWLHVDGAFGAFAAVSPRHRHLVTGLEEADSVTVDGHKWLNVPYDSALVFTRHLALQGATYRNESAYLPPEVRPDNLLHLVPENSQRLRALATWMTLTAYGRDGHAALVERCCALAEWMGARVEGDSRFRLLAPVRLNGLCFAWLDAAGLPRPGTEIQALLDRIRDDGTAFMTPTVLDGTPAIRLSITNWRTRQVDVERSWEAISRAAG